VPTIMTGIRPVETVVLATVSVAVSELDVVETITVVFVCGEPPEVVVAGAGLGAFVPV